MNPDAFTINEKMIAVGDGHKLYVQVWGNPAAKTTFVFLHGGPGSGCNDSHKALFNPRKDRVVFLDQRGAGKSLPSGALEQNNTHKLIEDVEFIATRLNLKTFVLVGGSWGSTLALAYSLQHPERVNAMVLRGLFTGSQAEIDFIDKGHFRNFFPDVWETFVSRTPKTHKADPSAYHTPRALSGGEKAARESAYAYSELEGSLISLDDRHTPIDYETFEPAGTIIEMHYLANSCFMKDGHILDNAHKLTMPVWLVQGRYDAVCPPVTAFTLSQIIPNSTLLWTIAGHSGSDRGNLDAVRSIISTL